MMWYRAYLRINNYDRHEVVLDEYDPNTGQWAIRCGEAVSAEIRPHDVLRVEIESKLESRHFEW